MANARNAGLPTENLFVKSITVDKGTVMRRARPFARGRSGSIRKTMSIVNLELSTRVKPQKVTRTKKDSSPKLEARSSKLSV